MITVKGNCLDVEFDHVPGTKDSTLQFCVSMSSEFVRVFEDEESGMVEIRITGNEEANDFLRACGGVYGMTVLGMDNTKESRED